MDRKVRYLHERHRISVGKSTNNAVLHCGECEKEFVEKINEPEYTIRDRNNTNGIYRQYPLCPDCFNSKIVETIQYGFYLRFAGISFVPCDDCQEEINDMLFKDAYWQIGDNYSITLHKDTYDSVCFVLGFLVTGIIGHKEFTPCKECQNKLLEDIKKASRYTFGNKEYEPAVELWRNWAIDDYMSDQVDTQFRKSKLEDVQKFLDMFPKIQ